MSPTLDEASDPGPAAGLAASPRQRALARLAASRARLRAQVLPGPAPGPGTPEGREPGLRTWWRLLRRQWRHTPLGLALWSWADAWWRRQPLATAAELGAAELRATVLPVVRRHPLAALAGAALLGGVLVASRRWLWARAARGAGMWRGHLGAWAWRQARDPAVQLLLMSWVQQLAASRSAAGAQAAPAPLHPSPGPGPAAPPAPPAAGD